MTVKELISKLKQEDEDKVVIFVDPNGGWTNIEIGDKNIEISTLNLIASTNMEK